MRKSGSAPVQPSPDGRPYLNSSQVFDWLKCRYRWNLGVERHIGTYSVIRPLELGSFVHAGMAGAVREMAGLRVSTKRKKLAYSKQVKKALIPGLLAITETFEEGVRLRGGEKKMDPEEHNSLLEIYEVSQSILRKQMDDIDFDRFTTVCTPDGTPIIELGMVMALPKRAQNRFAGYHGTPDWVVIDHESADAQFNVDYKVREQYTPPEAQEVNLQQAMYQRLLLANGVHTDGTVAFQIKAKPTAVPELVKKGDRLSKADIATDWKTYLAEIKRHGFDPADYEDMKEKLADKEWQRIERTFRPESEVRNIWKQIVVPVAVEIAHATEPGSFINPNQRAWNHMTCMGCWARDFCQAEIREEDTEYLLETKYVDWDNPRDRVIMNPSNFVFVED